MIVQIFFLGLLIFLDIFLGAYNVWMILAHFSPVLCFILKPVNIWYFFSFISKMKYTESTLYGIHRFPNDFKGSKS